MGIVQDEVACERDLVKAGLRDEVALELRQLLDSIPEEDLATVYRTLVGLMGTRAAPFIAEALGAGLRRGEIEMEPRILTGDAPATALVRRASRRPMSV